MSAFKEISDLPPELAGLQKISLSELHPSASLLNRYMTGKIADRSPLISKGKLPVLRFVLEEEASSTRINVYNFGDFATGVDAYKIGDAIYISNAVIERSHTFHKDSHHKCHLMVHKGRSHAQVWVCPQQNSNGNNTASTSAATTTTTAATTTTTAATTTTTAATTTTTAATTTTTAPDPAMSEQGSPAKATHARMVAVSVESSPMKTNRTYNYRLLNDLKETRSVDVYGVVKFFKPPYKTRGPDYCLALTIVDPSLPQDNLGLKCVLFHQDIKRLPLVHSIGDVVRLHRLRIQKYNSEFQGAKGDGFSSLVFDGRPNAPMEPRSSSPNYTLTEQDKKQVKDLRDWATQQTTVPLEGKSWTLSQIVSREYFDLTCQVVAMAIIPSESCVLIKVWDGTKYKWPVRCLDVSKVQVKWNTELACRSEGLMVDVALYDNHMKAGRDLEPGDFVRLYNVHAAPYVPPNNTAPASTSTNQDGSSTDMIELVLHRGTAYGRGLVVMKEYEEDVRVMKQRLEALSSSKESQSNGHGSQSYGQGSQSYGQGSGSNNIELDNLDWDLLDPTGPTATGQKSAENASWPSSLSSGQELRCMQQPISVITNHHDNQGKKIKQMMDHPPLLFQLKAAVVDYYPRTIQDFVHLFCQKCRMSCRIPTPKNAASKSPQDESEESRSQKDRKRKAEQESESPRRSRRIRRQIGDSSDSSQERDSERVTRRKGRQVTTVMTSPTNEEVPTALAYIKDLTVQESLTLVKEGMQLVRVPKLYRRSAQQQGRSRASKRTQVYVCPTCCPDQHENKDVVLLQYRYWLKLWLQDSTEKVETILQGPEAELFFGIAPSNLHVDSDSRLSIADKIGRLCPGPVGEADPQAGPKLECCVERLVSVRQGSRKVTYHIRDTQLALDVQ